MNFKQITSGLLISSMFLFSAYAAINSPMNNADNIDTSTNIVQLDTAITI